MTSKISFSKFLKEDIRHRGWLAALSFILLLLSQTVFSMLMLDAALSYDEFSSIGMELGEVRKIFPAMLNGNCSAALEVVLFLLALLCAATGFSYLHSAEKTDFYHSFPVSRTQWFSITYTGGLLIFLIPYLISSLLTLLAGARFGIMTAAVLGRSLLAVLGGILAFLVVYHTAVLAMMLTGKLVTGVLASLALCVYGTMAGEVGYDMALYFFHSASGQGDWFYEKISGFLSPFAMFSRLIADTSGDSRGGFALPMGMFSYIRRFLRVSESISLPVLLTVTILFLAVLWFLCLLLYKKRPSEAAGNALAYPRTAPVIKVLITIPTSLCIGILAGSLYSGSTKWIVIISLLAAILLCGLIEFIYHMDLRRVFAGKYASLISIAGAAAILCVFQFDLIGFDTWLPEESDLESMSFEINELYNYFSYPSNSPDIVYSVFSSREPDFLNGEEGQIDAFQPVYELAREGVENLKNGISQKDLGRQNFSEEYVIAAIRYNKKSGRPSYRNYAVSKEAALAALDSLCKDEEYRRKLFPVFYINTDDVTAVRLHDIYPEPVLMDLTKQQQEALFKAYQEDVLEADIKALQYEEPVGEVSVEVLTGNPDDPNYTASISNYLYESYGNTLALLEKYGYTIRRKIDPGDVEQMKYIGPDEEQPVYDGTMRTTEFSSTWDPPARSQERMVTDPKEIQEVLSQVEYTGSRLLGKGLSPRSVEILFKGNPEPYYYSLL